MYKRQLLQMLVAVNVVGRCLPMLLKQVQLARNDRLRLRAVKSAQRSPAHGSPQGQAVTGTQGELCLLYTSRCV